MADSKPPKPKPMPTTSMPDRVDPNDRRDYDQMKAGITTTGNMNWTGGKK